ncbi:hypothetical protein BH09ACT5_BH09ACT5_16980 [soil metagenome]
MDNDDEVGEENSIEPPEPAPGPRRSTFTPPAASPPPLKEPGATTPGATDDDALADALAADLERIASGPITIPGTIIPPAASVPPSPASAPAEAAPPGPTPSAYPAAAWSGFPAPDPGDAVALVDGPPVRKSMPDDELARWVSQAGEQPGGTLEVIERLQNQMKLREEEAREFHAWEDRMRSLGTPEALGAVDAARPQFSGILPDASPAPVTGSFVLPESPIARWPAPVAAEDTLDAGPTPYQRTEAGPAAEPEPELEPEPQPELEPEPQPATEPEPALEAEPRPLPAWEVPAPSASWSPPPEWGVDDAEALAQAPAPEPATRAPFDWSPDTAPVMTAPPLAPAPLVEPAPPGPPPSIPVADGDVVVPTLEPEPDAEPGSADAETEREQELTVEPLPDTGPSRFAPPPLIEPTVVGGPPILPSQAKSAAAFSFDAALLGTPETAPEGDEQAAPARPFDWTSPGAVIPAGERDDLVAEEPPLHPDPEPADAAPEALFIEPMAVAAGEPIPSDTGSITVIDQAYDEDLDDDVDETDRAFDGILGTVAVDASGIAAVGPLVSPPSGPISTVRIPEDEQVLFDDEPVRQPVFSIEDAGVAPTAVDHRVGRAARLFWLWFAANSSILSLGLGAAVFAVGMSLRQSIVAILAGVAVSFVPLGLTTLAGKRSGQPTMVVSRASFGIIGNVLPSALAVITRLFWGAVLLWLLGSSAAAVIVGAGLDGPLGERGVLLVSLAGAFLIAVLVAFAGYPMIARIQLVLSVISGILVIGLIAMTYQYIDIPNALTAADGPWILTVTGAVLVFSFVGLVWATSGADLARYQRTDSSGASSMLWATFGTAVPSFLLIGYGALLAASDKGIASGFLLSPLDTLALMLPSWYPVPLLAAAALSLLSGIILSLYSGGFALQSMGVRVKRQWSIIIVAVLLGGLALLIGFGVTGGINELFRDAATTLAVPTAAWAGIFAAETMIRRRRFASESLVRRGGVYRDVRWVNLIGLLVFSAVGYGLTTATVSWLAWQGYGFTLLGIPLDSDLAGTDVGVFAALVLGLLLPIVAGIPAIRKQEAARAPE